LVSDVLTSVPLSPPSEISNSDGVKEQKAEMGPSFSSSNSPLIPMTASVNKLCRTVLTSTQRHPSAWIFKQPVDPVAVGALNYFEIIKYPMDLSTISKRLAHAYYSDVQSFAADFRLMLDNCYTYNPPAHNVHVQGRLLDSHVALQFSKHFPALRTDISSVHAKAEINNSSKPEPHRSTKRNIRPPKIYEPEDISVSRKRGPDDGEEFAKKKRLSDSTLRKLAEGAPVDPSMISTLATCVQTMVEQLAMLQTPVKAKPKRKAPKSCAQCLTRQSTVWRTGPTGRATLCNNCGDVYAAARRSKKPVSDTEKRVLAERINLLSPDKMKIVAEILQIGDDATEIEIDLTNLEHKTCRRLFDFVMMQDLCGGSATKAEESSGSESDDGESSGSESE